MQFHEFLGIKTYPRTPAIDKFLDLAGLHNENIRQGTGPTTPSTRQAVSPIALDDLQTELGNCSRCPLHKGRTNIVCGEGSARAPLFIAGDWPGPDDDRLATPFSGEPGDLLDKMLKAIKLERKDVFLTHIIKCCPPANRNPGPVEVKACLPYLYRQIEVISPKFICAMGPLATQTLLKTNEPFLRLRGRIYHYSSIGGRDIPLLPTFHPGFLLKNPEMKKASWNDLQLIERKLRNG